MVSLWIEGNDTIVFILDDILLSPLKATVWLAEKIRIAAFAELTDDARVHEELLHLQMQYEMGEITDTEFNKAEVILMDRLEKIREMKEDM